MKIVKVFNNSVVLAEDEDGAEFVLFGRGIAFGKRPGADLEAALIERRFVPTATQSVERLAAYLKDVPIEDIELAQEIVDLARAEFGGGMTDHGLLPLADHLSFAMLRVRQGIEITYPLQWEVESLYPRELALARRAVALVRERRGVELPDLEAVPLALHFVNAQIGTGEVSETLKATAALTRLLRTALDEAGIPFDERSVELSRFLTHVRYLILRHMRGDAENAFNAQMGDAVRSASPAAVDIADRMADELTRSFGWQIGADERFYLALHAFRLLRPRG